MVRVGSFKFKYKSIIMKKIFSTGPVLIVIAALLWAVDGLIRQSLYSLPSSVIIFYEHVIGALFIAPFFFAVWKKEQLSKPEWSAMLVVALLSSVLGTLWFTTALITGSFTVAILLQKLQPLFTVATAAILLKEKITPKYLLWAGLAIVAAYFVTFKNGVVDVGMIKSIGIPALFAVGAAFAWGSTTAFSRFSLLKHSNTFITGIRFFLAIPIALIVVGLLGQTDALAAPSASQILRLVIIALSTGMVALWIYYRGLKHTEAKVATILELTFPVAAVLIDIFRGNPLSLSQYIAAAVLFFAMYQVSRLNSQKT